MDFEQVQIKYSKRKTLSVAVKADGTVEIRAPRGVSKKYIRDFYESHAEWVENRLAKIRQAMPKPEEKISEADLKKLKADARIVFARRVEHYAPLAGVTYNKINIRIMKSRWGSCTAKGDLCFNALLLLCPEPVLDSVVVHELCHRKVMNHSADFYREVYRVYPEYAKQNAWLKKNGRTLLLRAFG